MVTIYDLARETGYSAPTISKALNGNGKLNPKTREIILEAAKKAGYKPNMAAKSLTTKQSRLIGVILEDTSMRRGFEHPLFGGMLNRFRHEIEAAGYDLLFLSKSFNGGMSYIDHCKYRDVDGIIVVNPLDDDPEIGLLGSSGIPCVSTNEFIDGVCTVVSENKESGALAARKMIEAGHKKIGFLGAPYREKSPASMERYEGFIEYLRTEGIEFDTKYRETCEYWHEDAGYEGMKKLYSRCPDISAVFCVCDTLAFGAISYLREAGKSVPDDVSVIGFDDDSLIMADNLFLTTFRQNRDKIAELSAEVLLQVIAGFPVPDVVRVQTEFIERRTLKHI
ncbi:LacI family DNA-binding transcriptional regulator [Treponema sp.]|uniref:LacI family DNA-binding transcriptional regulator n=1 Tax=Treponema sp. TaxID=166 RepID=UPI00298D9BF4|nr:LacI family DNA-binding transcriptional regulator [Treponema sp.]MCR5612749.1 LacI family transcriptional regulator [Treponema sp.]